jgi:pantoate--beta-alanine ligase
VDLLSQQNIDYVFAPSEDEMFPRGFSTYVQVENYGERLLGPEQSTHLRGMTTAVLKTIHIVRPSFLFLGLKDALQGAILRKMIRDLNLGTEVVVAPVVRHASGLACGARNQALNDAEKTAAAVIYRSLKIAEDAIANGERHGKRIIQEITLVIQSEPMAELEYAFVADPESLESLGKLHGKVLIGVGARIGGASLNDSLVVEIPVT